MLSKIDSKGRLYIPKKMREKLTRDVYLVETPDGILIVPKPKDPIKELEKLGRNLPNKTIEELKKDILNQALDELK
ncbi:AbrB/MazE/SpoVT family DNA-binding domain-containing protein [Thermococcus sp. 2319x1]|uniref:AbrB/MazE/SpoVT family DNA-binding domain-containing protein n=1 Tax=Thermococcus sp. 2319x1 TaxID=1674923 RepID=UPI001581D889|nr:AbrB/MazE/SpoVT family DNA-binding domain-containing protein [Thermococcus sp. 2319x1]